MSRVNKKVEWLYLQRPQLVNSDKKLLLEFWRSEGLELSPSQQEVFMKCSPAESITRQARIWRKDSRFKPYIKKEVDDDRFEKFKSYKNGELF